MKYAAILVAFSLFGCATMLAGCVNKPASDQRNAGDQKTLTDTATLAKSVNGDYDKLTPDQKQQVLQMANGNEAQARQLFKMMAHPPNEANAGKSGAPPQRNPAPGTGN